MARQHLLSLLGRRSLHSHKRMQIHPYAMSSLRSPGCIRTSTASTACSSHTASPSSSSQPETPFAQARLSTTERSLLVRVLNRNLQQQREDSSLQSLSSDPLLTSLPAGKQQALQAPYSLPVTPTQINAAPVLLVSCISACTVSVCPFTCSMFANYRFTLVIPKLSNSTNGR